MKKRSLGIVLSYSYTFVNMLCGLFLSAFLLRSLGDNEYGLYQTVAAFANYLVMLEFGTGTAMTRNVVACRNAGDEEGLKRNISTIWFLSVALSVLIALVSLVFGFSIGTVYRETMTAAQIPYARRVFAVITAYLIMSFFTQTFNGILLGMEQYTFANVMNVVKVLLRTATLIAVISFRPYAMSIAVVDMCVNGGVMIATYVYCKKNYKIKLGFRYFDKNVLANIAPLCLALLLQTVVNQANNSVDKFIIGMKMTMESVALYSVAQYIYTVFSSITTVPISMYLPQVSKDISAGLEGREFTRTLIQPCRLVVLLGGLIMCGFFAIGRQFICLVYGSSKQEAWIYALIIIVPMFINMTNGILVNVLNVTNKRLARSLILIGTTALNIVLTWFFIDWIGIIGAVIATAISTLLGQVILMNIY